MGIDFNALVDGKKFNVIDSWRDVKHPLVTLLTFAPS